MDAGWVFAEMKALLGILEEFSHAKPTQQDNKKQSYLPEGSYCNG